MSNDEVELTPGTPPSEDAPPAPAAPEQIPVETTDDMADEVTTIPATAPVERMPYQPTDNVHLARSPFFPYDGNAKPSDYHISFLNATMDQINATVEKQPQVNILGSEKGRRWKQSLDNGQYHMLRGGAFEETANNPDALFRQSLKAGAVELGGGRPRIEGSGKSSNLLEGEHARMKMQALLGRGTLMRIPLWHTGVWIGLKAPTEVALLELERRIGQEKVTLGRATNGLIYSNMSVYLTSYLVNFVMAHLYEVNVKYESMDDLKSLIVVTDIQLLVWGLLCTMYPGGYDYQQPCLVDPATCNYVVEERIDFGKMQFVNNRAFTDSQRNFMTERLEKHTPEQVRAYQKEFRNNLERGEVVLTDTIRMQLRVPSILDHEQSGIAWVDGIVHQADQAFGGRMSDDERNDYILSQAKVSALRQYAYWVEKLVIINDPTDREKDQQIVDLPSLEEAMSVMSAQDDASDKMMDGIAKYIDAATVAFIGIPKYDCPACGKPMSDEAKVHPHLIPVDVLNLFFTMLGQRLDKVMSR